MTTECYKLPAMIAVAVNTDRGELCHGFAKSIESDNELSATLARLVGDLLNDRRRIQNELIALNDTLEQTRNQFNAFGSKIASALRSARAEQAEEVDDEE